MNVSLERGVQDQPWCDGVHGDARGRYLFGEGAGEPFHRGKVPDHAPSDTDAAPGARFAAARLPVPLFDLQIVLFDSSWHATRGQLLSLGNYVAVVVRAMSTLLAVLTYVGALAEPAPDPEVQT